MSSFRSVVGASRRSLKVRLDHLHQTLTTLGARLQSAVAEAIGQTIGGTVRETLLTALSHPDAYAVPTPHGQRSQHDAFWQQPEEPSWPYDSYDPTSPSEEATSSRAKETAEPTSSRLPVALTTGLRAAALWLRHWCGSCHAAVALAVGFGTAFLAYLAGPLFETGLSVIETADHLSVLPDFTGDTVFHWS